MAETRFIKTVAFGGYDKAEVVRRLEYLNSQVFDLKNELRETKLLLDAYKKGTETEKAFEAVIAGEKTKLTQLQVQNETFNTKLKAAEEENKNLMAEIKELKDSAAKLDEELKNAEAKTAALQAHNEAMALSNVFIEAQKSAQMLEKTSKAKAAELEAESKKLAENTVAEANVEAAQIIYEAEAQAAQTIVDAQNKAEQMGVASNNLRAVALEEVYSMREQVASLLSVLEQFREDGMGRLSSASQLLDKTEETLKDGGTPVFREPKTYAPELPEKPESLYDKIKNDVQSEEEKQKKKDELDKLRQMAESIGAGKKESSPEKTSEPAAEEAKPAEPAKEAAAPANDGAKKGGKIDLAALAAKAGAIGKK